MERTALITGASSGIGMETAFKFASEGYDLILIARRKERLENIKEKINELYDSKVTVIAKDLSTLDSAQELYDEVKGLGLKTDILINNAGFGIKGPFLEIDKNREQQMLLLNMVTLTKLCRLFARDMKDSEGGTIINVASTAAFQAVPLFSAYAATKSYVLSLSEALAQELRPHNINVVAVCPGPTDSEFGQVSGVAIEKISKYIPSSKDLAEFIFSKMDRKNPVAVHGFLNRSMICLSKIVPRQLVVKLAGWMINR